MTDAAGRKRYLVEARSAEEEEDQSCKILEAFKSKRPPRDRGWEWVGGLGGAHSQ